MVPRMLGIAAIVTLAASSLLLGPLQEGPLPKKASDGAKAPNPNIPGPKDRAPRGVSNLLSKLPMRFEKNLGQTDPAVQFLARSPGYSLFLTGTEAVFSMNRPGTRPGSKAPPGGQAEAAQRRPGADILRMGLVGANPRPEVDGLNPSPGMSNYFIGRDPESYRSGVPAYSRVHYRNVYPGIDMVYYSRKGTLEYDFKVAPGSDPNQIAMRFKGATKLSLNRRGDLIVSTAGGALSQRRPYIFQQVDGVRRAVKGGFVLKGNRVGFRVGAYDKELPLIIDPTLAYSSYFGGSGDGSARDLAIDSSGHIYLTGSDQSPSVDFPTQAAFQPAKKGDFSDAWVAKFVPDGSALVYSTFLGGSQPDSGNGIAADPAGNAYVTGTTNSPDFFTTPNNAYSPTGASGLGFDVFVTKFDAMGIPSYSTFLGGEGGDHGTAMAVDGSTGKAFVTGKTDRSAPPLPPPSRWFPTTASAFQSAPGGATDAFIAVIDTNKAGVESLVYSSLLGGDGSDEGSGIDVRSGVAYVTGKTSSAGSLPFPTRDAFQVSSGGGDDDAFFASVDTNRAGAESLTYSTFLGGDGSDGGKDVGIDNASGRVAVVGTTNSSSAGLRPFPTKNAFQPGAGGDLDGFVAVFEPKLLRDASLLYSTYLGGAHLDALEAVVVDAASGQISVGGFSEVSPGAPPNAPGFPTRHPLVDYEAHQGRTDVVVAKLDMSVAGDPSLLYSTFLGGAGIEGARGVALDKDGNLWVGGRNVGGDYPTTANAFQDDNAGTGAFPSSDAILAKLEASLPVVERIDPSKGPVAGGTRVTIEGKNLKGAYQVKFGEAPAVNLREVDDPNDPEPATKTSLEVESPPHAAGSVHVRVLTYEGISRETPADIFTYENTPILPTGDTDPFLAALAPPRGPTSGGTPVLITGIRFTGATEVRFGGVVIPAGTFSSASDSDIRLLSPPHEPAETVKVRVVTANGVSNPADFTYFVAPAPLPPAPASPEPGDAAPGGGLTSSQKPFLPAPPGGSGLLPGPAAVPAAVPQPVPGAAPGTLPGAIPAPTLGGAQSPVVVNAPVAGFGVAGLPEEQVEPAPSSYNMTRSSEESQVLLLALGGVILGCWMILLLRPRRLWSAVGEDPACNRSRRGALVFGSGL